MPPQPKPHRARGSRLLREHVSRRTRGLASPRLQALAREDAQSGADEQARERCELCNAPLESTHRHLLDLQTRELMCACRPCSLLFDRRAAGGGRYRLVGERRLRLESFRLDDVAWEALRIPVDMACFHRSSETGRVNAFYPSPMGPTESRLELEAWHKIEKENEILATLEPDVEALLVNRTGDARDAWIVPIEDPYRLVAIIRTRWRGFTGGKEVWLEIERFFGELDAKAKPEPARMTSGTAERR